MLTQAKTSPPVLAPVKWQQVFVLSLPRSGSTLLRLILDTHPDICCPGELSLGQLCDDLYRALYYSIAQASTDNEAARVAITLAKTREAVGGFMGSYAAVKEKRIWAEKTPTNIDYADILSKTFPDAAFICLHRNLLDLIRSGWEMTRYGKMGFGKRKYELWDYQNFLELCERQTRALLDFERGHSDRAIRLHYEPLVQNPAQELSRLFAFLELPWDPSLIEAVFSTEHDDGIGDPKAGFARGFYTTSVGRGTSAEVLADLASAPKYLQNKLSELLRELGYPDIESARVAAERKGEVAESNAAERSAVEPIAQVSNINDLFTHQFLPKLNDSPRKASDLKGAVKFVVRGKGGGTWTINLNKQPPAVQPEDRDADCTITIKADDLLKLATGELNVGECYLQARLRVAGNEALALSLGRTLFA